jgi:hypothetical protein
VERESERGDDGLGSSYEPWGRGRVTGFSVSFGKRIGSIVNKEERFCCSVSRGDEMGDKHQEQNTGVAF